MSPRTESVLVGALQGIAVGLALEIIGCQPAPQAVHDPHIVAMMLFFASPFGIIGAIIGGFRANKDKP